MQHTNPVIDEEIQTIQSIFPEDFQKEVESTKAWKGVSMPPSFTLRIASDDPELEANVYLTLHIQYSKTYPAAPPTFTIKPPIGGLSSEHVKTLTSRIQQKAKELARNKQEMIFDIRQLCVEYMSANHQYQVPKLVKPEVKSTSSLATEMKARAEDAKRAQKALAEKEADGILQFQKERASLLANEMELDRQRREQKLRVELEKKQARERFFEQDSDDSVRKFVTPVKINGTVSFNAVKILSSRKELFETISMVQPVGDHLNLGALPDLELHTVVFNPSYYGRSQGKKRLLEMESELQSLQALKHPNVARLYAAELRKNHDDDHILSILLDRQPPLTLQDVLEQSDVLRPEKAIHFMIQILQAIDAFCTYQAESNHDRVKFCHRGVSISCVGLKRDPAATCGTRVQICRGWYYGKLLDMDKSNAFNGIAPTTEDERLPRLWTSREAQDNQHVYNQRRDIWDAGIVLLQMLLGLDVMTQYPAIGNALDALSSCAISDSLLDVISSIFDPSKRSNLTCRDLIRHLEKALKETPKDSENGTSVPSVVSISPRSPTIRINGHGPGSTGAQSTDYFGGPAVGMNPPPQTSRYRDEWQEIEFLGKGGYGSVVKARFRLDGAVYAVKKVKLRGENDGKIYREINALSKLNHRFIVRYHTTWIEDADSATGYDSPSESADSTSVSMTNGLHRSRSRPSRRGLKLFREDLSMGGSLSGSMNTTTSFPVIRFAHSDDEDSGEEDEEEEDGDATESATLDEILFRRAGDDSSSPETTPSNSRTHSRQGQSRRTTSSRSLGPSPLPRRSPQMMYIQMEYVERQTLKEAIEDGLSEKECWRLFRQILEALAHIASLGIIHRDVKLTNIFIGANGDVKVGDFGLATSSLAGIDPSDVSQLVIKPQLDITYGVGTALYTAPEVLSKARGHSNHSKADMYSLGIVFFEMCWPPFDTGSERVEVLTKLRLPTITFPTTWEGKERQRTIITKLLQHNPNERPSAAELFNSSLLPEQEEDAYFEEARRKIQNSDEQCEIFINELFQKKFDEIKQLSYDMGAGPAEHSSLNDIVQEHLEQLFRLHGAVHKEPHLLIPLTDIFDDDHQPVKMLDSAGRAVFLPRDHIVAFARLSIPSKDSRGPVRVKRFHIGNVYIPSPTGKQPVANLMAAIDIIHTDVVAGAAEAELIRIANEALNVFPGANTHQYEVLLSHSHIVELVFGNMERSRRKDVSIVLSKPKAWQDKRNLLLKLGLPRTQVDQLEVLADDPGDDVDDLVERLERFTGPAPRLRAAVEDVKRTLKHAETMGVTRPVVFRPLIMFDQPHFREGIMFEIRGAKRGTEPIVRGGRYDHLISKFAGYPFKSTRAIGMQIAVEPLVIALAENLAGSVPRLIKDQRSFGYWSPSRCDVYVVSFQTGLLAERVALTTLLWQNGIRADLMYESAIEGNADPMSIANTCALEGILFMVWPRPKTAKRDTTTYKVKSVLKKTEDEVSPQELIPWLTSQISEQRRFDLTSSGSKGALLGSAVVGMAGPVAPREPASAHAADVQVIVSNDVYTRDRAGDSSHNKKSYRHKTKAHHAERALATEAELRASAASGMSLIAVEMSGKALELVTANMQWLTSEPAWKSLLSELRDEVPHSVTQLLKEAVTEKLSEGGAGKMLGLMSLKEDRIFIIRP